MPCFIFSGWVRNKNVNFVRQRVPMAWPPVAADANGKMQPNYWSMDTCKALLYTRTDGHFFLLLPLLSPAFLLLLLASLALPSCSCCLTATPRNVQLPRLEKAPSSASGRRPVCCSLKLQLAIFLLLPLLTPQNVQLPRLQKSAFATFKHHGREGRNGPPGDGLYFCFCRCFLLPSCSCSWPFLLLLPDGHALKRSAAKARKKRLRHTQTPWQ